LHANSGFEPVGAGVAWTTCGLLAGDTLASRTFEFLEPNGPPFLAKPFLVEELKLAVNHALQSHSRRDRSPPENSR